MAGRVRRWWVRGGVGALVLFAAVQLVPYGRDYRNPPVVLEPAWDSRETRDIAQRACFDCHSNQTQWPGYARIAPGSWLIAWDVREGREHLNFSEWHRAQEHADDAADVVRDEEMPPVKYRVLHPDARLSDTERDRLARGLAALVRGPRVDDERRARTDGHQLGGVR